MDHIEPKTTGLKIFAGIGLAMYVLLFVAVLGVFFSIFFSFAKNCDGDSLKLPGCYAKSYFRFLNNLSQNQATQNVKQPTPVLGLQQQIQQPAVECGSTKSCPLGQQCQLLFGASSPTCVDRLRQSLAVEMLSQGALCGWKSVVWQGCAAPLFCDGYTNTRPGTCTATTGTAPFMDHIQLGNAMIATNGYILQPNSRVEISLLATNADTVNAYLVTNPLENNVFNEMHIASEFTREQDLFHGAFTVPSTFRGMLLIVANKDGQATETQVNVHTP